jgi:hypothetical protein
VGWGFDSVEKMGIESLLLNAGFAHPLPRQQLGTDTPALPEKSFFISRLKKSA